MKRVSLPRSTSGTTPVSPWRLALMVLQEAAPPLPVEVQPEVSPTPPAAGCNPCEISRHAAIIKRIAERNAMECVLGEAVPQGWADSHVVGQG